LKISEKNWKFRKQKLKISEKNWKFRKQKLKIFEKINYKKKETIGETEILVPTFIYK